MVAMFSVKYGVLHSCCNRNVYYRVGFGASYATLTKKKNSCRWILKVAKGYCQLRHVCLPAHLSTCNSAPAGSSVQKFVERFNGWLKSKKKRTYIAGRITHIILLDLRRKLHISCKSHRLRDDYLNRETAIQAKEIVTDIKLAVLYS